MDVIYQFLQHAEENLRRIPIIGGLLARLYHALLGGAPEWVVVVVAIAIPILFIISVFPGIFAYTTLVERKALGRIQNRFGPNRVGRWGILQPIADGAECWFT